MVAMVWVRLGICCFYASVRVCVCVCVCVCLVMWCCWFGCEWLLACLDVCAWLFISMLACLLVCSVRSLCISVLSYVPGPECWSVIMYFRPELMLVRLFAHVCAHSVGWCLAYVRACARGCVFWACVGVSVWLCGCVVVFVCVFDCLIVCLAG